MVSDILGITWEILTKKELERTKGITFLKYMAINQSVKRFISNADKQSINIGPYRPVLLNVVFLQQKGCQNIYRKTGHYGIKILQEISHKSEMDLMIDIEIDEVKQFIKLFKKHTPEICICGISNTRCGMRGWLQTQDFVIWA